MANLQAAWSAHFRLLEYVSISIITHSLQNHPVGPVCTLFYITPTLLIFHSMLDSIVSFLVKKKIKRERLHCTDAFILPSLPWVQFSSIILFCNQALFIYSHTLVCWTEVFNKLLKFTELSQRNGKCSKRIVDKHLSVATELSRHLNGKLLSYACRILLCFNGAFKHRERAERVSH